MKIITLILGVFMSQFIFAQKELKTLQNPPKGAMKEAPATKEKQATSKSTPVNEGAIHIALSMPKEETTTTPQVVNPTTVETEFVPIPATQYTDPNYEKNLAKSKAFVPFDPASQVSSNKTAQEKIADYEELQKKYEVNSVEYNHIKSKIAELKSSID